MNKEKRRVPKLRFPGFTEDWEQRKLSDISTKVTTKNVDVHYTETLTNSAEQGIISQVDFFDKEISNKDNINGYYIVENNDFIYNPRISTLAPVGPINRNKLNRTGIMSPLYTVFRASTVDLDFLEWYFQSSHWHRYMKLNGDSGARSDRIAIKDSTFFDMPIKTPVNIKEQVLIGETLEMFNQYITLHQRKLEHLNLKKKALLQKLFPKNGERYPELRFPGFTDAWEQCKLESLGKIITGNTPSTLKKEYWSANSEGVVWITPTDINSVKTDCSERLLTEEGASQARIVPANSILVTCIASIGKNTINTVEAAFNQQINALVPHLSNSYFILTMLNNMESAFKRVAGTSATSIINKKEFGQLSALLPSVEEQNKIGEIFELIDKSITLHQ